MITPWIFGDSVGLHPLAVMLSILLWTVILRGSMGALLAAPPSFSSN
jgi:predicted PurR-regulated permease PerM